MGRLTQEQEQEIIRGRGSKCESEGNTLHGGELQIHHKDRDPHNNDPSNLAVYCQAHHPWPRPWLLDRVPH